MTLVRLVSATRMRESEFWRHSYLGRSLLAMPPELRPRELAIRFENVGEAALGLSTVYNRALEDAHDETVLLFVHDDVFIHDPFVCSRLAEGLEWWDVIGLAGSFGSDLRQPSWGLGFEGEDLTPTGWQRGPGLVLSGSVSHATHAEEGRPPAVQLGCYGPPKAPAQLLDGLFLAARAGDLRARSVSFDERFAFHLYDLDFCRLAVRAGLRPATWPILVTHASGGAFGTPDWKVAARTYLDKWDAIERSDQLFGRRSGVAIGA